MMKKTKLAIAISLLSVGGLISVASVASARDDHGPGSPGGPRMHHKQLGERFDTNRDGKLDDAERQAMHQAMAAKRAERQQKVLAQHDTNRNGKLDDAERQAMRDQRATERFTKLDTNRDGALSLAEFKAAKLRHKHDFMGPRGGGRPPGERALPDLDQDED
jgi:hypothetical protein